ncbi:hypothetical protein GCM10007242_38600 [Pigmentiphaga litoralis]|jgi:hypothetical protein|uniref:DUF4286 family protein n=1 Tax=Pigmentiphaga litoralis TaxID=516702 RepID=UPI00167B1558|nr:DUF4286 family protein [Pigmentiphaga litoralis]GGX28477.1 hypothetical protein GCM10007242_38600 [Pigmentiphaga litoralis]
MTSIDVLLIKLPARRIDTDGVRDLAASLRDVAPPLRHLAAHAAIESVESYVYLALREPGVPHLGPLQDALARLEPGAQLVPLQLMMSVDGASAGKPAPYHYVVETDVVQGGEADLNAWYDQEHLPGLASVPGTVLAQRLSDPTGSPRYHALYELETQETFGSPAWLKVRASPWSDRVRPMFRNPKRTMFHHVLTVQS